MALVDYTSDSDASGASDTPNSNRNRNKRQKTTPSSPPPNNTTTTTTTTTTTNTTTTNTTTTNTTTKTTTTNPSSTSSASSSLPPLPPTFHDLYATPARTTTHDDPALHQGRTRQTPHTPGLWPSHVYVEWHPGPRTHELLAERTAALQSVFGDGSLGGGRRSGGGGVRGNGHAPSVSSFLTSDLGVALPLHISLTRPVAVGTGEKGAFLKALVEEGVGGGGGDGGGGGSSRQAAFQLAASGVVEWHRTGESGRSFLVLRVRSLQRPGGDDDDDDTRDGDGNGENPNPELTALLRRCNAVVARYGQPGLYEWAEDGQPHSRKRVGEAFHVSIAWSFAEPTEELVRATEQVFGGPETQQKLRDIQIPVDGIKVKIGNVITNVALRQPGARADREGARNLLGL